MYEFKYAIVCIDDDPSILQMLSLQLEKIIQKKSTLLEYFTDPEEASKNIGLLAKEQIDAIFIIVDYQMPNLNGGELIKMIKEQFPNIKCVMLSGQANAIVVDDLVNENLLDYFIPKPWDEADLVKVIQPIISDVYGD